MSPYLVFPLLLVVFVLGICFRWYFETNIKFDDKVDLADLLSVTTTIIIAWYLGSILDRQKTKEQGTKAVLSKRVEEVYDFAMAFGHRAESMPISVAETVASIKTINTRLETVFTHLDTKGISIPADLKKELQEHLAGLSPLMTQTPAVEDGSDVNRDITVKDSVYTYSTDRRYEIGQAFSRLREKLTDLQFQILDS